MRNFWSKVGDWVAEKLAPLVLTLVGGASAVIGLYYGLSTGVTAITCEVPGSSAEAYACHFDSTPSFYFSALLAFGLFLFPLGVTFLLRKSEPPKGRSENVIAAKVVAAPALPSTGALTSIEAELVHLSQAVESLNRAEEQQAEVESLKQLLETISEKLDLVPRNGRELLFGRRERAQREAR